MGKNRRRITIEVTPQTLYHLENMAREWMCTPGAIVDVLMMEHKENQRHRNRQKGRMHAMFGNKKQRAQELPSVITIHQPPAQIVQDIEYRPCWVHGKKALFHRWANDARPQLPHGQEPGENARYYQFRSTKALVEFEDGTMETVWPQYVKFADNGRFRDYAWEPMERGNSDG